MSLESFSAYLAAKAPAAIGAAFGAAVVASLWIPKRLRKRSAIAAGIIIGGTSIGSAFAFAGLIAMRLGLDPKVTDVGVGIGIGLGVFAVPVTNWLINFFEQSEDKHLLEVAKEVK